MARFDVYGSQALNVPLVLEVQANILQDLDSCIVVPLLLANSFLETNYIPKLMPLIRIGDAEYILMTTDIATIPRKLLIDKIDNIEADYRDIVTNALDFLFQGF